MMHVCFPWPKCSDGSAVDARRLSYAAKELEGLVSASLFAALSIKPSMCKFKHCMQALSRDATGKDSQWKAPVLTSCTTFEPRQDHEAELHSQSLRHRETETKLAIKRLYSSHELIPPIYDSPVQKNASLIKGQYSESQPPRDNERAHAHTSIGS